MTHGSPLRICSSARPAQVPALGERRQDPVQLAVGELELACGPALKCSRQPVEVLLGLLLLPSVETNGRYLLGRGVGEGTAQVAAVEVEADHDAEQQGEKDARADQAPAENAGCGGWRCGCSPAGDRLGVVLCAHCPVFLPRYEFPAAGAGGTGRESAWRMHAAWCGTRRLVPDKETGRCGKCKFSAGLWLPPGPPVLYSGKCTPCFPETRRMLREAAARQVRRRPAGTRNHEWRPGGTLAAGACVRTHSGWRSRAVGDGGLLPSPARPPVGGGASAIRAGGRPSSAGWSWPSVRACSSPAPRRSGWWTSRWNAIPGGAECLRSLHRLWRHRPGPGPRARGGDAHGGSRPFP